MELPVLSIIGSTATGKTQFALQVAQYFASAFPWIEIISADSRQVYKGMEIGTGVDVPPDFVQHEKEVNLTYTYFQRDNIRLHGLAIVSPDTEWSVAHFRAMVKSILALTKQERGLVIMVGGTGLYHQHAFHDAADDLVIRPNAAFRKKAMNMPFFDLQKWLQEVDPQKWSTMNNSDQHNPRRVLRSIEVAVAKQKILSKKADGKPEELEISEEADAKLKTAQFTIGLIDESENLAQKIRLRVADRITHGFLDEVQRLVANYPEEVWRSPAFSATGYKEGRQYLDGVITLSQLQEIWTRREVQYAKRQKTWWKKYADEKTKWYQVSEQNWQARAVIEVKKWLEIA